MLGRADQGIGSCRTGNACPFLHDTSRLPGSPVPTMQPMKLEEGESSGSVVTPDEDGMVQDRRQAVTKPVDAERVVQKPVPQAQAQDPREFQLGQIRRRFSPKETVQAGGNTMLKFSLKPSDPDFPYEMTVLECLLSVPKGYPISRPILKVENKDIPRGFSLNVEHGFEGLVEDRRDATLLELTKFLDKNLEAFLSAPKADTVKLVPNKDTRHLSAFPSRSVEPVISTKFDNARDHADDKAVPNPAVAIRSYTADEKIEASKKREAETRQLEARMGRLPLFKKSGDGIAYTIPIEPRRRGELPVALQFVKSIQIFVPVLYPLEPCRIQLDGVDTSESKPLVKGFEQRVGANGELTLMGHVNYLAQNMHALAKTVVEPERKPTPIIQPVEELLTSTKGRELEGQQDADRTHIQYITRPPEWTVINSDDAEDTDSDDVYAYDTEEEPGIEGSGGVELKLDDGKQPIPISNQEKGTALSFPFIELYGIELLEVTILNITVKCERCKDVMEITGLRNGVPKTESCKKCTAVFNIGFRRDLVHAHAVRAGFLDLDGCVVGDMLPRYFLTLIDPVPQLTQNSTFIPTCSQCSTSYSAPGIISVGGETTSNVCRECHQKFTFKIPQVKFLRITSSHLPPASGPRRKKEVLGLTPGTELPRRGRCRHYTKSYRWFRFSCCQKVYACDKCHDDVEEHPNEWANRMICGWCSREGNYRPEDCGFCHGVLIGKRGGGFWEGGKGTRDRVRMSRKDKRKFRRPGGAAKANA
jgi:uncharacterized CHY-type Zn-finger protein